MCCGSSPLVAQVSNFHLVFVSIKCWVMFLVDLRLDVLDYVVSLGMFFDELLGPKRERG